MTTIDPAPNAQERMGSVKELGHAVLYVRDLDRSVRFYGEVLGWGTPMRSGGMRAAAFTAGSTHHELLLIEVGQAATPIPSGPRVGLYHLGIKVGESDDELRAALERLQQAGTPILGMTDHHVTHSVYIADPDGNELELYIDVPGVNWRDDPELLLQPPRPLPL